MDRDPDSGMVDDKMAEARERIGRINRIAGSVGQNDLIVGEHGEQETIMKPKPVETATQKVKAAIADAVGLPPGDRTPHGAGRPARDPNAPHGSLTADDRPKRSPVNDNA